MKFSRWFVLGVVGFLALVFVMQWRAPRQFAWEPTYDRDDRQPFGCYVFDSVVRSSLPVPYTVERTTLYQLNQDSTLPPRGILIVTQNLHDRDSVQTAALMDLARRGNRILLACESVGYDIRQALHFDGPWGGWWNGGIVKYVKDQGTRDTIVWPADDRYPEAMYCYYPHFIRRYIEVRENDSLCHILAYQLERMEDDVDIVAVQKAVDELEEEEAEDVEEDEEAEEEDDAEEEEVEEEEEERVKWISNLSAVEFTVGKGAVIIAPQPLAFTNYGILDGQNRDYVMRLLSQLDGLPVVRVEAYNPELSVARQSPLRFINTHRPLKWALRLALLTVVVFMVFTARRRQRPIPIIGEPQNRQLEFIRLIGTLYYQRHNHRDLVLKKFVYFAEEVRTQLGIDITDREDDDHEMALMAERTGMDEGEIRQLMADIRRLKADDELHISRQEMLVHLARMNRIIKQL